MQYDRQSQQQLSFLLVYCSTCNKLTGSSAVAVIADRTAYSSTIGKKYSLLRDFCFFLTLFIVITASRPVNINVSTGAVIRAKRGTELGVHKLLAKYQTGFGYKFRPTNG